MNSNPQGVSNAFLDGLSPEVGLILWEILHIDGLVPVGELEILYNVVRDLSPKSTLEVGLASGSTAITIMAALGEQQENPHIAIDPFQTSCFKNAAQFRINRLGWGHRFELLEVFSHIAMPYLLMSQKKKIDFSYIDGNHLFDCTMLEIFYIDKMLETGGHIAFDDCDFPAVEAAVNFLETNLPYTITRASNRTWIARKTADDKRKWFEFKPFSIPNGIQYTALIEKFRSEAEQLARKG